MAFCSKNRIEYAELFLGCSMAGGTWVPVNPLLAPDERKYILSHSKAKILFFERKQLNTAARSAALNIFPGSSAPEKSIAYRIFLQKKGSRQDRGFSPGGSILYTAGTTGVPKGCVRPEARDMARIRMTAQTFNLTEKDVHLTLCPLTHSAPSIFLKTHLFLGAKVIINRKFDALQTLRIIEKEGVTNVFMVPSQLFAILSLPEKARLSFRLRSLRAVIVAGAPLRPDLKKQAVCFFGQRLYEFYGATELGMVTVLEPEDFLRKAHTVGKPVPGVSIKISKQDGEILVKSPMLMSLYHKDKKATRAAFRKNHCSAGDTGSIDREGFLTLTGRKRDMIISGGVNVYALEVENAIISHHAVSEAAVFGKPDPYWGEAVCAAVVLKKGRQLSQKRLTEFCRKKIAVYKIPKRIYFVKSLPKNTMGKVLKHKLRNGCQALMTCEP